MGAATTGGVEDGSGRSLRSTRKTYPSAVRSLKRLARPCASRFTKPSASTPSPSAPSSTSGSKKSDRSMSEE